MNGQPSLWIGTSALRIVSTMFMATLSYQTMRLLSGYDPLPQRNMA